MTLPDIRTLVPHKGRMMLLDRLVSVDAENLCAAVTIRSDSLFCGEEGVGSWVGIEYMAQAIAAHAGYISKLRGEPVKVGFLLGTRRYDAAIPVFTVGSELRIVVSSLLMADNGLGSFACRVEDASGIVATATINVFQPENVQEVIKGAKE